MDYGKMVENALRGVVRAALLEAAEHGFRGNHHFYISFAIDAPGVVVPDHLRQRFQGEMTIVLQHQFWGLEVSEEGFEVTLSFNKVHERLQIPLAAVTDFHDPSVPFGLRFGQEDGERGGTFETARPARATATGRDQAAAAADDEAVDDEAVDAGALNTGQVVTLDSFRNKK